MYPADIGALVSFIGLLTQTGGALLLAGLFMALLRSHPRRRPYFREWTRAWVWLLAALLGVVAQYVFPRALAGDTASCARPTCCTRRASCSSSCTCWPARSTTCWACGRATFLRRALPVAVAYGLLTTVLPGVLLNGVMLLQAPLVAGAFVRLRVAAAAAAARRAASLGSRAAGAVFAMIALLWMGYAVAFAMGGVPALREPAGPLDFLLQYNSYLDLLLQMLLGYGMVVLLLEDAKRDADDARAQLAVAHDRLKRVTLYDALTGALNRRAYEEGVGLEAVGARFGTAIMLDMDNLKAVNDAYGHAAGDELLRRLVETVRGCVRPMDRVYRWGGDEFLVLFPAALPGGRGAPRARRAAPRQRPLADGDGRAAGAAGEPGRRRLRRRGGDRRRHPARRQGHVRGKGEEPADHRPRVPHGVVPHARCCG